MFETLMHRDVQVLLVHSAADSLVRMTLYTIHAMAFIYSFLLHKKIPEVEVSMIGINLIEKSKRA